MLLFWLLAAVMLAVALLLVLPPLLSARAAGRDGADEQVASNVVVFRDRIAALEAEHAAGDIDDESLQESRLELQRELLHDTGGGMARTRSTAGGGRSPFIATLVAAALPLLSFGLYLHWGSLDTLDPAAARVASGAHAGSDEPDMAEVERMVENLATRLQQEPDDGEGWHMLARSYAALGRHAAAAEAFSRARDLLGEDPDLLVDWAEALGMASGENLAGEPAALIERALALDPGHARALWLGGFAALQSGQPALAVQRFRSVQALLPPDSEAGQAIASMLAQMGAEPLTAPAPPTGTGADTPAAGASIDVEVSLAPELAGRLRGDESLFVFARAAEGPRIPLAVVRSTAAALPLNITLDESQAMQPGMTISSVPRIVVGARLTRGAQPTSSSGDLEGFSQPVEVADGPVKVVIDQVVP